MSSQFKELADKYYLKALNSLKEFVSINTINDQNTVSKEHPFGNGVEKGLSFIAKLGRELGFNVDRCDNYVTELSIGNGPLVDIYAHADVVPVSKTWKTDPFVPTIINNVMYARGASDDKGPGIASLYAAKAVLDTFGIEGYKLRIIFGGDEERGSACLDHYFNVLKKEYPKYGFSPDADFPLIYGEKSIYSYSASYNIHLESIEPFTFGNALNIVLDEANIKLDSAKYATQILKYQNDYPEVKLNYDNGILHFKGQAAHGSTPWNGVNAGLHLLNFLGFVLHMPILNRIFENYENGNGEDFNGNYTSEHFDSSSYNVGKIAYENGKLTLFVNMRLPENVDVNKALDNLKKETKIDDLVLLSSSKGFVYDPKSKFVQTLLKTYQEETGDLTSQMEAIGGGTYSRETKNTVAFGMQFPGVDTLMHQDGEFLRLDDFKKGIAIYAHAIYELGKLAKNK